MCAVDYKTMSIWSGTHVSASLQAAPVAPRPPPGGPPVWRPVTTGDMALHALLQPATAAAPPLVTPLQIAPGPGILPPPPGGGGGTSTGQCRKGPRPGECSAGPTVPKRPILQTPYLMSLQSTFDFHC